MSEKQSGSCIKVNGVPLLPPIITSELRDHIEKMRQQAKLKEFKGGSKDDKRFVNKWTEADELLELFSCGQEGVAWTGASTRRFDLVSSSTQTTDCTEYTDKIEKLSISEEDIFVTACNSWTQMSKSSVDSMTEAKEYLILKRTSDIATSDQIELEKRESLQVIREIYPMKKDKSVVPMSLIGKRGCSSKDKEKWTSCPNHLDLSCTVPNEDNTIESSIEKWKRWRSLPDVHDIKPASVGSSQSSEEYIQDKTDSPGRQKSHPLVQPSKDLLHYVKQGAYGYGTSHFPSRQKSYNVMKPSKYLLDYVKTKGHVGPVEENTSGASSSRMPLSEIQSPVHCSHKAPIICQKCKKECCVCSEDNSATYTEEELRNKAATIINAGARGFFVRRLMRTRRVRQCIDNIRYLLECHFALTSQAKEDSDDRTADLQLFILRELLTFCEEFYDFFFNMSKSEQLQIIASDRLSQFEQ